MVVAVEVRCKRTRDVVKGARKETKEVERSATRKLLAAHVNRHYFRIFALIDFEHTMPSILALSIPLGIRIGCERLSKALEGAEPFTVRRPVVFM
jgi:hypothetical protein